MRFLRQIIGLIATILLSILSAVAMPVAPSASHQVEFFPYQEAVVAEHTSVHFAARAPPLAATNVAVTGTAVAEQGNCIIMHGNETQVASFGFDVCLDAPNSVVPTNIPTSGRKFNQLTSRGWDQSYIDTVVNSPVHTSTATNRATGNPATAYFDNSGNYVVRDNVTGDLVQMSNRNDPNWIPDPSITDPYIP
ncbi:colicin E5-related ribonuclease [Roseobacter sp. EG26]|uniref:colicin E5-related ribonuclease n=1 Tax=Roseobacter sp. EG26 TaxID=3412477 RepID=UPI003CE47A29